ncbi:MAG: ARMT1-like domain-containing protein [Hespellia sp.]|nr:ARMT1-like domain-containing protein [Hespellia sp.]
MQAEKLCIECCLNKAKSILKEQQLEKNVREEAVKKIEAIFSEIGEKESAPYYMSKAMEVAEDTVHIADSYVEPKRKYNQLMLQYERDICNKIEKSADQLLTGLQYALTGNYIDFAAMDIVEENKLMKLLEKSEEIVLDPDTYRQLQKDLKNARTMVYITDNAGEIVLDKIMILFLKRLYPQLKIQVIVRGAPALNDATMDDAFEIGLTQIVSVITNKTSIPGTPLHHIAEEAKRAIEMSDLCIAKGQGNYETMDGCGLNIYYLFLCKCELFVKKFQVEQFTAILKKEI